jgi:hypothetical protein
VPRLTADQWAKVRAEYEAGSGINAVAAKHGVSRKAVQKHIAAEGWTQDLEPAIRRQVAGKVAGAVAAGDPVKTALAMSEEAGRRAEVVLRHRAEWKQVIELREEALRGRLADPGGAFERAKIAKITSETIAIQQAGERKAWGLEEQAAPETSVVVVDLVRVSS